MPLLLPTPGPEEAVGPCPVPVGAAVADAPLLPLAVLQAEVREDGLGAEGVGVLRPVARLVGVGVGAEGVGVGAS